MERSVEQIKKNTFPLSDNNSESKKFLFFDTETTGFPKVGMPQLIFWLLSNVFING